MDLKYQGLVTLCEQNGRTFHQLIGSVLKEIARAEANAVSMGKRYVPGALGSSDEQFVNSKFIADFLGISTRTLTDWCDANRVTYYRPDPMGGMFLFRLSEVKADMEKIKVSSMWKNPRQA